MSEQKKEMKNTAGWRFGFLGLLSLAAVGFSSCVPLAIGATGVAVGYIARDEGIGQAPSVEQESGYSDYDSY